MKPNRRPFYNLKQGRGQTRRGAARLFLALRKIVRSTDHPPVVALMECRGNWDVIRRIAKRYGYRIYTGTGDEGSSSALLVRDDVKVLYHGIISADVEWMGPQGRVHPGRSFPWVTVQLDGQRRTFVAIHMPWNPARNAPTFRACVQALDHFAQRTMGEIEFLGDWNTTRVAALARRLRARVVRTGDPLMFALVREARPRRHVVIGDAKSNEGSDHPYAVLRDVKEVHA